MVVTGDVLAGVSADAFEPQLAASAVVVSSPSKSPMGAPPPMIRPASARYASRTKIADSSAIKASTPDPEERSPYSSHFAESSSRVQTLHPRLSGSCKTSNTVETQETWGVDFTPRAVHQSAPDAAYSQWRCSTAPASNYVADCACPHKGCHKPNKVAVTKLTDKIIYTRCAHCNGYFGFKNPFRLQAGHSAAGDFLRANSFSKRLTQRANSFSGRSSRPWGGTETGGTETEKPNGKSGQDEQAGGDGEGKTAQTTCPYKGCGFANETALTGKALTDKKIFQRCAGCQRIYSFYNPLLQSAPSPKRSLSFGRRKSSASSNETAQSVTL